MYLCLSQHYSHYSSCEISLQTQQPMNEQRNVLSVHNEVLFTLKKSGTMLQNKINQAQKLYIIFFTHVEPPPKMTMVILVVIKMMVDMSVKGNYLDVSA
jgi:hypothetical protein